jgi:hypothetical protein
MVESGVSPTRAAKKIKDGIKAGKITSAPLKGSLGGGIKGSRVFKGGANRSATRGMLKAFGKNKATTFITKQGGLLATKSGGSRIPIIGPLIVGVTSYLETGKLDQALFRAGGALLGGFLGTFIPIPVLGTIVGELVGEYIGDLFYTLLRGKGAEAVGKKLQDDIKGVLRTGAAAMGWVKDGLGRMYEGIPKFKIPEFFGRDAILRPINNILKDIGGMRIQDMDIPNPFWFVNPFNLPEKLKLVGKAFFSRDPMIEDSDTQTAKAGKEGDEKSGNQSSGSEGGKKANGDTKIQEGNRPGSDALADHSKIAASAPSSKTDYNAEGGSNKRRIFLHWSAGSHSHPYDAYHSIFLGSGEAVRNTPYGVDKGSHTAGANTNSIGLSIAAMAGGTENGSTWPTPPTQKQLEAMTAEAAQIAVDWGYTTGDVDRLVMTHGEWERYATKNGILPGRPQRWDLDKLKPSDPNIDTSKVKSHGGDKLRQMIKQKMNAIRNGQGVEKPQSQSSAQSTQQKAKENQRQSGPVQIQPTTPMAAGSRSSSPSEGKFYGNISSMTDAQLRSELDPTMTARSQPEVFKEASAARERAKSLGLSPAQTERLVLESTVKATRDAKGIRSSDMTESNMMRAPEAPELPSSTPPPSQISPMSDISKKATSIEAQAEYERFLGLTEDGGEATVVPVPVIKEGGGGSRKSSPSLSSSSDGLNSYYKAQVMGHLYKFG